MVAAPTDSPALTASWSPLAAAATIARAAPSRSPPQPMKATIDTASAAALRCLAGRPGHVLGHTART
jgi:hypothetical protein